jgi:hypothetical protein
VTFVVYHHCIGKLYFAVGNIDKLVSFRRISPNLISIAGASGSARLTLRSRHAWHALHLRTGFSVCWLSATMDIVFSAGIVGLSCVFGDQNTIGNKRGTAVFTGVWAILRSLYIRAGKGTYILVRRYCTESAGYISSPILTLYGVGKTRRDEWGLYGVYGVPRTWAAWHSRWVEM